MTADSDSYSYGTVTVKNWLALQFILSCSFVSMQSSNQAIAQEEIKAESQDITIGGRPEAPLLQIDTLPKAELPNPERISAYPEIDYSDFVKNPELLFLYSRDRFGFKIKQLVEEVENIAVEKTISHDVQ